MIRPSRNIALGIFGSALILLTSATTQAGTLTPSEHDALRQLGTSVIGTLPDKMPGSEEDTPEMVELGRTLFFDVRLSANNSQSCNTCHAVDRGLGGVDNEATSLGAFGKRGGRNSPTVLNAGFHVSQFWDGRAGDLAEQAKGPILNPIEMGMPSEEAVVEKLSLIPEYVTSFGKVFGTEEKSLTYDNIAKAIAAFERTLITRDRFDDFLKGQGNSLNEHELKGLQTFVNVGCVSCHSGPTLGGNQFQKLGLINPYETKDFGRYDVTKDEADKFKFKVPSLRNIAITGPYFHDGAKVTLEETIREMGWLQLGKKLEESDVQAIRAFLEALTCKERTAEAAKSAGVTPVTN